MIVWPFLTFKNVSRLNNKHNPYFPSWIPESQWLVPKRQTLTSTIQNLPRFLPPPLCLISSLQCIAVAVIADSWTRQMAKNLQECLDERNPAITTGNL